MKINIHNKKNPQVLIKEFSESSYQRYSYSSLVNALGKFNYGVSDLAYEPIDNEDPIQDLYISIKSQIDSFTSNLKELNDDVQIDINHSIERIKYQYQDLSSRFSNSSIYERERLLADAINHASFDETLIRIPNIEISDALLNPSCPDILSMAEEFFYTQLISSCSRSCSKDKIEFIEKLDNARNRLSFLICGDNINASESICMNAHIYAASLFGENEFSEQDITPEIYSHAIDNVNNIPRIVNLLEESKLQYNRACALINNYFEKLTDRVLVSCKMLMIDKDEEFVPDTSDITEVLQKGFEVCKDIINIVTILLSDKIHRIEVIIDGCERICDVSSELIARYGSRIPAEVEINSEISIAESFMMKWNSNKKIPTNRNKNIIDNIIPITHDDLTELQEMEAELFASMMFINEDLSSQFNNDYKVLLEGNDAIVMTDGNGGLQGTGLGDKPSSDAKPSTTNNNSADSTPKQDTTTNNNQNKTTTNETDPSTPSTAISRWLDGILSTFANLWHRFQLRIEELFIKNAKNRAFWEKNKKAISQMTNTIGNTKVSEWVEYQLDIISKSNIIPDFDVTKDYLQSDTAFQNQLMELLNPSYGSFNFEKTDSFTDKITKIFQNGKSGSVIKGMTQLSGLGFDATVSYNFIDNIMTKGFSSNVFGTLNDNYKTITVKKGWIYSNYSNLLKKITSVSATPENQTNNTTKSTGESANLLIGDFKFNLAKHFGLIHEAEVEVDSSTQKTAEENGIMKDDTKRKKLDGMIKRYFTYTTNVIAAKMTATVKAFKQIMNLYIDIITAVGNKQNTASKETTEKKEETQPPANQNNQK